MSTLAVGAPKVVLLAGAQSAALAALRSLSMILFGAIAPSEERAAQGEREVSHCLGQAVKMAMEGTGDKAAAAGAGGAGGAGGSATETTSGSPGSPGAAGIGQGDSVVNLGGAVTLKNSIFSPNSSSDTNLSGTMLDAGNNIDSIVENELTNSTSLNGVNPDLAPLENYGGPTPTMALLPGSPAIDAADLADFPATDQRGVPRPFGPAPDIGAFEDNHSVNVSGQIAGLVPGDASFLISPSNINYVFAPAFQTVSLQSNQTGVNFQAYHMNTITLGRALANSLNFIFAGTNGQSFRIETSTNFTAWTPITTNAISAAGYVNDSFPVINEGSRFFRVVSP